MSEIRVKELRIGKGITKQNGEHEWRKSTVEVLIDTEGLNEVEVAAQHKRMENYLDRHLGIAVKEEDAKTPKNITEARQAPAPSEPEPPTPQPNIPEFDPKLLTEHQWKGKRKEGGGHEPWNHIWGWDRIDQFPSEILECLPITIGEYEFSLNEDRNIVNVQKAKP